jgi:ABC-type polysaccharide/polyol phosphate export permease
MTGLIESFRRVLIEGQFPEAPILVPSIVGAVLTLAIGTWYFAVTESRFADVI